MAEQALIGGDAHTGAVHLTASGLTAQLPGEFTHLRQRLGRDGFAETCQAPRGIHRHPATDGGGTRAQQLLGTAHLTQPKMLVPVQLHGRGQVVHLGQVDVVGAHTSLLVGVVNHRRLEAELGWCHHRSGVGGEVG